MNWLHELGALAREILCPLRCTVCGAEVENGLWCPACAGALQRPLSLPPRGALEGVFCYFPYNENVKDCIRLIKFEGQRGLVRRLAWEARRAASVTSWPQAWQTGNWVMCGVPTDARRKQERGFDLPEELLQPVAQLQGLPWQQLLARVRPTHHLYDLPPQERRKALLGCFAVQADVRGKSIMLADDIFTTGATMQACARVLRQAGAARVAGLAFSSSPVNFADAGAE